MYIHSKQDDNYMLNLSKRVMYFKTVNKTVYYIYTHSIIRIVYTATLPFK